MVVKLSVKIQRAWSLCVHDSMHQKFFIRAKESQASGQRSGIFRRRGVRTPYLEHQRRMLDHSANHISSVPWKCQKKCTMLLRDKGLQSSLQKIVTFMFQALVLVHNIVTSVWNIYFCCTALCSLLLSFYSIVTHSKAGNCHFDVSGFYREAKYLHFLPVFDDLIKGT